MSDKSCTNTSHNCFYPMDELTKLLPIDNDNDNTNANTNANTTANTPTESMSCTANSTKKPTNDFLFTVKDNKHTIHHIISIKDDSESILNKWQTSTGITIDPQRDSPGYRYYLINNQYRECYNDIWHRLSDKERYAAITQKNKYGIDNTMMQTLEFMKIKALYKINGNIEAILAMGIIISIIISIIYLVKNNGI